MIEVPGKCVSFDQAALRTGLSPTKLKQLVVANEIPHYQLSERVIVFDKKELEAWMGERYVPLGGRRSRKATRKAG